jgi:hypothetical protein
VTANARGPRKLKSFTSWLAALTALVSNRSINLLPYLDLLLPTACTLLLADRLSPLPADDHWALRRGAGALLARVAARFSPPPPQLLPQLARVLAGVLADARHAMATLYGAVVAAEALGGAVANEVVVRGIAQRVARVKGVIEEGGGA